MTSQTRRRIGPLVHGAYRWYVSWTIMPPRLVWDAPGRHAHLESII